MPRLVVFILFFVCASAASADKKTLVVDIGQAVEQLAANPCVGDDCDQKAVAVATEVARQIKSQLPRSVYEVTEDVFVNVPGGGSGLGLTRDFPYFQDKLVLTDGETHHIRGELVASGCDVSWIVSYAPGIKGDYVTEYGIGYSVSGTCPCETASPGALQRFHLSRRGFFEFSEEDNRYVSIYLDPESLQCNVSSTCGCAIEMPAEDAIPAQDAMPGQATRTENNTFLYIPGEIIGLAKKQETCGLRGEPCDAAALKVARSALTQIGRDLPGPQEITFPHVDDGKFETFKPPSAQYEQVNPGHDVLDALMAAVNVRGVGGGLLKLSGSVETECGDTPYIWYGKLNYDDVYPMVFETSIWLFPADCECRLIDGKPLGQFHYSFSATQPVGFAQRGDGGWDSGVNYLDEPLARSCLASGECCGADEELGDAFPGSEAYVLHFDSPLWCTYGGGSIPFYPPGFTPPIPGSPLPGLGSPMPIPGQSSPPVPPGDTPGRPPAPGVPVAGEPGRPGQPGQPSVPGVPAIPVPPAEEPDPAAPTPPVPPTAPAPPAPPPEETPPAPLVPVPVKATRSALASGAFVPGSGALATFNTPDPALAKTSDDGFAEGENSFQLDAQGEGTAMVPEWIAALLAGAPLEFIVDPSKGFVLQFAGNVDPTQVLHPALLPYVSNVIPLRGNTFISLLMSEYLVDGLQAAMNATGALSVEPDVCVDPKPLADPYFSSAGSWSQAYPDQWAIQRVGFTADTSSAWDVLKPSGEPIVVAVIDSGLDWNHREIPWASLWQNPGEIKDNGIDDDGNGYIDDLIGWDFWDGDNRPWDVDGHGTFVAGILFADASNGEGIVGIARNARLMVLKAMNAFGHSRASSVAKAIIYAADNGARVINLSLGGPGESTVVREAIDYAFSKNVVVVVAAGNEATPTGGQSVAGLPNAITVAATNTQDRRSLYSNYGAGIDIAAPGDDVLSLRARRTDLLKNIPDVDYEAELAFVGEDRRYYRASGTSFATPIVAGVASLVLAERPELTAAQVKRILKQTAEDIETPGVDHFTGYGLVDAKAALSGDPDFHIDAEIAGVAVVENKGKQALEVRGTAIADAFKNAVLYIGPGSDPTSWQEVARVRRPISGDILGVIPATSFAGSSTWYIRLVVTHRTEKQREYWFKLDLG